MMSVKEYAIDVNKDISSIIDACHKLNINITNSSDMLSEEDIIALDSVLDTIGEVSDENPYEDDSLDEIEEEIEVKEKEVPSAIKMKKVPTSPKKDDSLKFKKAKKEMYKHKEKLDTNKDDETNIVLYKEGMTVKDLADTLNINSMEIIKKLMNLGVMCNINQSLDFSTVEMIVIDYNKELKREETRDISNFEEYEIIDKEEDLIERAPVVTIMGHVDHGKTSLLDAIRDTNVALGEAGGITQAIGAYQVKTHDRSITFIDTPGHEAFTEMRSRGAQVTDIVVIVVSAEDGVKPQTIEAIDHAKAANVPIIIAINKMDLPNANPDRVLEELTKYGITPEEWGGDTLVNRISAKTRMGLDELLDNILLVCDMNNLKANPNRYATGTVIEARLDKSVGPVCTLLVQNGTLRLGDPVVVGCVYGKVRSLKNDKGQNILSAIPSTPVEVTGLSELPSSGDRFMAFETEKEAKKISLERTLRNKEANTNLAGLSLEDLYNRVQDGVKKIDVVLKADVKGSEEAIKASLSKVDQDGVKVNVIRSSVGAITESDINLAAVSGAIIIGFNIRPNAKITDYAKEKHVDIRLYTVIYKILEDLSDAIKGMLDPIYEEKTLGVAEVRQLFKFSKVGTIAGSIINEGVVKVNTKARVVRDSVIIYDGKISSIQRGKDKTTEVKKGIECGITLDNFSDIKEGDTIESYDMVVVKK